MKKQKTIQRVDFPEIPIHCPFCGSLVVDVGEDCTGDDLKPCPHTLFIAHDLAFEYRSAEFNRLMKIDDDEFDDGNPDLEEESIDEFTDRVPLPDGIKFACYQGPPSEYGSYVGFSPDGAE